MLKLRRKFCLLLSIWVFNLSVDAPDVVQRLQGVIVHSTNCLDEQNEIESIGEWLVEHVLGFETAVPEGAEATDAPDDHRSFEPAPLSPRLHFIATADGASAAIGHLSAEAVGAPQRLDPPPPRSKG